MKIIYNFSQTALVCLFFISTISAQSLTICLQNTNGTAITNEGSITFNGTTTVNEPFQIVNDCRVYEVSGWEAGDYSVDLNSSLNPLNGITTFDLVLVHRHILGIDLLDSPLKIIAADVNNSNSISTFDMVLIRRLILNIDTEWPNGLSYIIIPANYSFPDPTNPWADPIGLPLNDTFTLPTNENILIDAVRIKKGDVNF